MIFSYSSFLLALSLLSYTNAEAGLRMFTAAPVTASPADAAADETPVTDSPVEEVFTASPVEITTYKNGNYYNIFNISIPRFRLKPWAELADNTTELATQLGYDETTWNNLFTFGLEEYAWDDIDPYYPDPDYGNWQSPGEVVNEDNETVPIMPTDLLINLGFDAVTWDCWMNHFEGYNYQNLVEYNISEHFEVLGYFEPHWKGFEGYTEIPEVWNKDWDDLTQEEQQAAANICYLPETWNGAKSLESGWMSTSDYLESTEPWNAVRDDTTSVRDDTTSGTNSPFGINTKILFGVSSTFSILFIM